MDYKEKYEQALERALKLRVQNPFDTVGQMVEHIFPELQESEDERIRKGIIRNLEYLMDRAEGFVKDELQQRIVWLEKQGEQPIDKIEPKFNEGDYIVPYNVTPLEIWKVINIDDDGYYNIQPITNIINTEDDEIYRVPAFTLEEDYYLWSINDANDGDVLVDEDNNIGLYLKENDNLYWHSCIYLGCDGRLRGFSIGGYHNHKNTKPATKEQRDLLFQKMKDKGYEWRQDEKKLIKINEPKFNEGDFIMNNDITEHGKPEIFKIIKVCSSWYDVENVYDGRQTMITFSQDYTCHIWSIEDAKEGDILVNSKGQPFIFSGKYDEIHFDNPIAYCGLNCENKFKIGNGTHWTSKDGVAPATKEQRDLLFKEIHDAGYTWDSEKKELKRIEQQSTDNVEPKFKVGNWYQCTKDFFGKGVTFDKNTVYYCAEEGCLQDEYGCHIAIVKDLYDNFKLWTIADAKDGDVLAINWNEYDDSWEKIIIFKKYHNKGVKGLYSMPCVEGYGNTFKNGKLAFQEEVPYYSETWRANLHPATKEQRDLLFRKMKEAGYEWEDDKKELKKIEVTSKENEDEREALIRYLKGIRFTTVEGAEQVINWIAWLEKQGEQPTKIEPKLKVDDWVVSNNDGGVWQIGARYTKEGQRIYLYNVNDVIMPITLDELNNDYHLWTINDAKDGDVLVASDGSIFLFAGVDDCSCKYYAALTTDNYVKINKEVKSSYWETSRAVYPATKEQRELLFQKMKEAKIKN